MLSDRSSQNTNTKMSMLPFFKHEPNRTNRPPIVGNDTPLHTVIRTYSDPKKIYNFIQNNPAKRIVKMARTTNDNGKTPLDLIEEMNIKSSDREKILSMLLQMIKEQKFKPMNKSISTDRFLKNYDPNKEAELCENIKLACDIVNEVRKIIKSSRTHPDLNNVDNKDEKTKIDDVVDTIRIESETPAEYFSDCKKYAIGNCNEFSFSVMHFLQTKAKKPLQADIVEIKNGDHAFVVFGPKSSYDVKNYKCNAKNTQAVFCDAWSGTVGRFNQDDMKRFLGNFNRYYYPDQTELNVVTTFNPNFHRLTSLRTFDIPGDAKLKINSLGLFDKPHNRPKLNKPESNCLTI